MKRHRIPLALAALMGGAAPAWSQTTATDDEVVLMEQFQVTELRAFSDAAIPGTTPVSFTELGREDIQAALGSRDIPLVLNTTPSVFATTDSGGAGDARVNIRGFNQRNISILINGVPTNDIENGWLYWSNWDGLGDVTATIQIQRGLSNVTLPTPSIAGTMNIITDPAATERGGSVKAEVGSDSFKKVTLVANTGLVADRFALTLGGVAKNGDGYVDGTYTKGWAYYAGATFIANERNRFELFAIGAPQRHGQRSFASNIAAYDTDFARKLGYSDAEIEAARAVGPIDAGDNYNPNFAPVSSSYRGKQYYWGGLHDRQDRNFINERENYFHKPQLNLNWYLTLSDTLKLTTVVYYSGGRGGGAGTLNVGSSSAAFGRYPNSDSQWGSNINWDATIASNAGAVDIRGGAKTPGQSLGILRNSVNNQDQWGAISKLTYEVSEELSFTTGLDWRTAELDHFREVRDLLGGDYYLPSAAQASEFWPEGTNTRLGLGDKVDYHNTNTVDWLGLFVQGQYDNGPWSAFGVYGYSSIGYEYVDHFRRAAPGSSEKYSLDTGSIDGHQVKGGVNYDLSDNVSVYVNAGWVSKVPVFDGAINDVAGVFVDTENEEFVSYETGIRFQNDGGTFGGAAGVYHTEWRDRTVTAVEATTEVITYMRGVDSDYQGVEIEGWYRPLEWLRFDVAGSYSWAKYISDVQAESFEPNGTPVANDTTLYVKGVKVGDSPQTQLAYAVTVYPTDGMSLKLQGLWYDRYWADYLPDSRTNPADAGQAWQLPSYTVYDLHLNYDLPVNLSFGELSVFAHVFNLFDEVYVSDATDNSSFEGIRTAPSHTAQRAEVFLGPPRTYNVGVRLRF